MPVPQTLERLARDYPVTTASLLVEALTARRPDADPSGRWRALVEAHGPERASEYLRRACLTRGPSPVERVVERLQLEGYTKG